MRVLIDAHMIGERETGNETYIAHLVRAIRKLSDDIELVVSVAHEEEAERKLGGFDGKCKPVRVSDSPWLRLGWELSAACREERVDLLHVTYTGPLNPPCPVINSVHDVAYKVNPEWFSPRDRLVLSVGIRNTMRHCARVITISEHSKTEIIRYLHVPAAKIDVTSLAAGEQYRRLDTIERERTSTISRYAISEPFVLAVGNLQPRKNLLRLIDAFAMTLGTLHSDCSLVLVGKAQWRESEVSHCIEKHGLKDRVVFTGYVSDEDLVVLFNKALVFAYPSLYEGFGLPILEAMACGTPVLTSNASSMPEVANDSAILVDPLNVSSISAGLTTLLGDAVLRDELAKKGIKRASEFSWEACAKATLKTYNSALNQAKMRQGNY